MHSRALLSKSRIPHDNTFSRSQTKLQIKRPKSAAYCRVFPWATVAWCECDGRAVWMWTAHGAIVRLTNAQRKTREVSSNIQNCQKYYFPSTLSAEQTICPSLSPHLHIVFIFLLVFSPQIITQTTCITGFFLQTSILESSISVSSPMRQTHRRFLLVKHLIMSEPLSWSAKPTMTSRHPITRQTSWHLVCAVQRSYNFERLVLIVCLGYEHN